MIELASQGIIGTVFIAALGWPWQEELLPGEEEVEAGEEGEEEEDGLSEHPDASEVGDDEGAEPLRGGGGLTDPTGRRVTGEIHFNRFH